MNDEIDVQLIKRCIAGEHAAFEILVQRYQVLVCSIAYSIVGNVSSSEDVGQEVFLSIWTKLSDLRDPQRFNSWLSTITRNEARAWLRRRSNSMQEIAEPTRIPEANSENDVVDQEEADMVWKALSQLPESYREPLVLYYRHEQSVAEVADALSLSQPATKQRLARGREMLHTEVMATIEQRLRKTVPTAAFTVDVMAVVSGTTKTAAAATGVGAAKIATAAAKSAAGSAAAGTLIGLLGGFAGGFASWYSAEYQSQRTLIVRQSVIYLTGMSVFMLPFVAMRFGWRPMETLGGRGYGIVYAVWMLCFVSLNFIWMFWCIRSHKRLQQQERSADSVRLPRHKKAQEQGLKITGRRWTSVFSVGFVSIGVLSIAPFAAGVVCIGGISIGGAIAAGYLAVAPLAFAIKAAKGAMAFSIGFAEAPLAFAPHANDELARQYMDSSDCILQLDQWLPQSSAMATGSSIGYWVLALIVLLVLAQRLEFKRQVD